jgi:hypothetical protein
MQRQVDDRRQVARGGTWVFVHARHLHTRALAKQSPVSKAAPDSPGAKPLLYQ